MSVSPWTSSKGSKDKLECLNGRWQEERFSGYGRLRELATQDVLAIRAHRGCVLLRLYHHHASLAGFRL